MTENPVGPTGVDELIGERVHAAMWRARITQTQLARALGIDQAAVARRLRGRTPWKVSDVVIAARVCGTTVEEMMPTHDELGHVVPLTRGIVAAETRCTPALANLNALGRARHTWGTVGLIPGNRIPVDDLVDDAARWAVGS